MKRLAATAICSFLAGLALAQASPPGVKHWHGASATTAVTHLALQETVDGKNVEWMEKVSEETAGLAATGQAQNQPAAGPAAVPPPR
jgi:hypothetical protein